MADVAIVIRASGERTEGLCRTILAAQAPDAPVLTVGGGGFPDTLRRSLLAGIEAGRRWTLCMDGDVIPVHGCVAAMVERAESLDRPVFELQGMVLDKLFGVRRPAGNHLYRTDLLAQALPHIPPGDEALRPESAMILAMSNQGYHWWQDEMVVGLHDFGQWSRDIARKVFVQAAKFQRFLPFLHKRFTMGAEAGDTDFQVALAALAQAAITDIRPVLDANRLAGVSAAILAAAGISEKRGLDATEQTGLQAHAIAATVLGPRLEEEIQFAPRFGYL